MPSIMCFLERRRGLMQQFGDNGRFGNAQSCSHFRFDSTNQSGYKNEVSQQGGRVLRHKIRPVLGRVDFFLMRELR
eukprot:11055674-Lingulodinium_polyedra.AAC.1